MRKSIFSIALLLAIGVAGAETLSDEEKLFDVETMIIKYDVVNSMGDEAMTGTQTAYYDNWGRRQAVYSEMAGSLAGEESSERSLQITGMDSEWIYVIDLVGKTGMQMDNPAYGKSLAESKAMGEQMAQQMMGGAEPKKTGVVEKIAGEECEVMEIQAEQMKSQSCMWQGTIQLKADVEMAGMKASSIATEITKNAPIPEGTFDVPEGIHLREMDMSAFMPSEPATPESEPSEQETPEPEAPQQD